MSNTHVQAPNRPFWHINPGNSAKRLWAALVDFQQRYEQRRHLLELDDRLLDDIGFSRGMATQEAAKPFWQN